ncbi:MAG: hypothetical protein KIT31_26565 [Deltaproteobacteria bacterium]|nr:hypothetical protein [Deltaproteobacteria bacterium]
MKRLVISLGVCVALALAACGKKSDSNNGPSPELTGLAAVPASAEVVIGVNVPKLGQSQVVERAIDQVLLREPSLLANWQAMRDGCKIEISKQIKHITLAIGATPAGGKPGTGPLLAVATGQIPEHDLAECVTKIVGKGNGTVSGKDANGRTLYQVKDGERMMFFAFGRADTVVLGNNEAFVVEALGTGAKAIDHPELSRLLKMVNQNGPIWAVGRVDERVKPGMVRVTKGKMKAGPSAFLANLDPSNGVKAELGVLTATPEDAKVLESYATEEKKLLAAILQGSQAFGQLISKVEITSEGSVVWLRGNAEIEEINRVFNALDAKAPSEQVSPPPSGSGSSESPKNP